MWNLEHFFHEKFRETFTNFDTLTEQEKFIFIMCSESDAQIEFLSRYIKKI